MKNKKVDNYVDGVYFDDEDDVGDIKGFVDGYGPDDVDDVEMSNSGVEYGLCSQCCSSQTLISHVYIELNDDEFVELEDVCVDCILEKILEYTNGVTDN